MYLRFGMFLADTEEQWSILGLLNGGAHPDTRTLVPKGELYNLTGNHTIRTEKMHAMAIAHIQHLNNCSARGAKSAKNDLLATLSMRDVPVSDGKTGTTATVCIRPPHNKNTNPGNRVVWIQKHKHFRMLSSRPPSPGCKRHHQIHAD